MAHCLASHLVRMMGTTVDDGTADGTPDGALLGILLGVDDER